MDKKTYRIADFVLDTKTRQLFQNNESVHLSSRAFDILLYLIENRGEIVEKNALMDAVWNDSFVEESNLAVHISALRRLLKEKESNTKFIKTISGRGYSFVAPIDEINKQTGKATSSQKAIDNKNFSTDGLDSIAVLPFTFNKTNAEIEYIANGLAQSLISDLSQIPKLKVIAYSAVRNYKLPEIDLQEIGFLLNANKLITGHLSEHKGKLDISIELVNSADTSHIWGTQGSFEFSDIMRIKKEISIAIVDNLKLQLPNLFKSNLTKQAVISSDAYNLYLKGKYMLETISMRNDLKSDLRQALTFFKRTLKKESKYAPAYAGIGDVYIHLFNNNLVNIREASEEAGKALKMAIALDENLSEAYVLKGTINILFERNLIEAEKALTDAIRLNPNNAEAYHWKSLINIYFERFEEAFSLQSKAIQLAPTSIPYNNSLVRIFYYSGDYNKAIVQAEEILELDSRSIPTHYFLALSYAEIGLYDEALKFITHANEQRTSLDIRLAEAYIYALMGKINKSERKLDDILSEKKQEQIDYTNVAAVYAALKNIDEAFDYLDRAYHEGNVDMYLLGIRPQFKNLRNDERYKVFLEELGLNKRANNTF